MGWREFLMFRIVRTARRLHFERLILLSESSSPFLEYFKGFENVEAVKKIFGQKTSEVLRSLKVDFIWAGYMGVNDYNGHIVVNSNYLNNGDRTDIYLDIIHELVHVKQYMEGRELFDSHYDYVERPTEIEAYCYAVEEARRLGWNDAKICGYLKTEWMSNADLKKLATNLDVCCDR